jgi:hypothetical protein
MEEKKYIQIYLYEHSADECMCVDKNGNQWKLVPFSSPKSEGRTYSQKELYQFVTEYSREAREEGFDMSVGDFVDWVASRDEEPEEYRPEIKTWRVNCEKTYCQVCARKLIDCRCLSSKSEQDKPVLPEKLELPDYLEAIKEDYKYNDGLLAWKINELIDYLKEKNL